MTKIDNKKINELAGIVKNMPPGKIRSALVKDKAIYMRVTESDKESIKRRLDVKKYYSMYLCS